MEENIQFSFKKISALGKVFADVEPIEQIECNKLTALRGETVSYQIAFSFDFIQTRLARVKVQSPIEKMVRVREVVLMPSHYPTHKKIDDNYISNRPGLYPDLLKDLEEDRVLFVAGQWRSIWVDIEVGEAAKAGTYPITIEFCDYNSGEVIGAVTNQVTVYPVTLGEQKLIRTEWFHADCLADYYKVEIFSQEHWDIMESFLKTAYKHGCNMILTPQFTPPLDTAKGYERETVQLVDITVEKDEEYVFEFTQLKKWVDMCKAIGFRYFEMSHLFTQWGAVAAPKIMATINGEYKQLFGWETEATGEKYQRFLNSYLPELIEKLKEWKIDDATYFHVSDEPILSQLETYSAAKNVVAELLKDFPIIDALSDYEFYKTGAVEKPVCANNHIHTFIENQVEGLWSYYCTAQYIDVSNRFCAMPSARNRIYGVQLFKYKIEGALHWGYNFYNGQDSFFKIDPYRELSCGSTYPAGDPFLVYPGKERVPEESIRLMVQSQAMCDLRALQMLEEKIGYDKVVEILEEGLEEEITFKKYPKSDAYLIKLRNKVNELLAQYY